jgi:uncharacterized protein (DUF4415 family)
MVKKKIDISKKPTKEQIEMLKKAAQMPITYDDDSPMLTDEELLEFRRISEINKDNRRKQTVTLRLSPQAVEKAKSLGKGYTSVLSRILETALSDNEIIKQYL